MPSIACQAAGGRDALALFNKAIECGRQRHQGGLFFGPDIGGPDIGSPDTGDAARQTPMRNLVPEFHATPFKPDIQLRQIGKVRHRPA